MWFWQVKLTFTFPDLTLTAWESSMISPLLQWFGDSPLALALHMCRCWRKGSQFCQTFQVQTWHHNALSSHLPAGAGVVGYLGMLLARGFPRWVGQLQLALLFFLAKGKICYLLFSPATTASGKGHLIEMVCVQATARIKSIFLLYYVAGKYKPCLSWIPSLYYVTQSLRNVVPWLQWGNGLMPFVIQMGNEDAERPCDWSRKCT